MKVVACSSKIPPGVPAVKNFSNGVGAADPKLVGIALPVNNEECWITEVPRLT